EREQSALAPMLWPQARTAASANRPALDLQSRLDQARREGFANGLSAAQRESEQALTPGIERIAGAGAALAARRDVLREQAVTDLVQLTLTMAGHVLKHDVSLDNDVLAGLFRASFAKLRPHESTRVRIHPAFEAPLVRFLAQTRESNRVILIADGTL